MSDPAKYRTKEELEAYKDRDPLLSTKHAILENNYADDAWFAEVEADVKKVVEESVKFAEESPYPTADELYKDVYVQQDYPFILD
ncbi:MAG TPA: pyruvate dehydrogenase (acetyl-transferring) E1 component subunit alpha, partial [Sphingobacterium sp.]|jgi:pyruvate dehydrogenase E1 component alpha subunit|nr:pyruvate dehydrogenase (acetyl-transferring) E1 component subunit alpha [Sphingobacterium sp.]